MPSITPVYRNLTTSQSAPVVLSSIDAALQALDGRLARSETNHLEYKLGSLLRSRFLGEFWVSHSTLPKKAIIQWEPTESGTQIQVWVVDTHRFGFKWGFRDKYEIALSEVADAIVAAIPGAVVAEAPG